MPARRRRVHYFRERLRLSVTSADVIGSLGSLARSSLVPRPGRKHLASRKERNARTTRRSDRKERGRSAGGACHAVRESPRDGRSRRSLRSEASQLRAAALCQLRVRWRSGAFASGPEALFVPPSPSRWGGVGVRAAVHGGGLGARWCRRAARRLWL